MNEFRIVVYGTPAPQGSKRHVGNGVMIESSKKVKPWRQDVLAAAIDARDDWRAGNGNDHWENLDGPLVVDMVFTFVRPKSHYRTGKNAHLLKDNAPRRPAGLPDLSKLARSTEDALTKYIWTDDARIVEYGRLAKVYAREDVDALDAPGAIIRVRPYDGPHPNEVVDAEIVDDEPTASIVRTGRNYAADNVVTRGGYL